MTPTLKFLAGAVLAAAAATCHAQNFPARPVTLTVGFAPGGGTDTAARIIANLRAQTGFYLPEAFLERGDLTRARLVLGVAAAINPEDPAGDYNLACASARSGDVPLALKDLDRAVAKGFKNLAAIDDDPDFERIRADPRFQKWLRDSRAGS